MRSPLTKLKNFVEARLNEDDTAIFSQPVDQPDVHFDSEERNRVCPVTRQPLAAGTSIYQCSQCGINISKLGWEFLLDSGNGRCCDCGAKKTVGMAIMPE